MGTKSRYRRFPDKFYVSSNLDFQVGQAGDWVNETIRGIVLATNHREAVLLFARDFIVPAIINYNMDNPDADDDDRREFINEIRESDDGGQYTMIAKQNIRVSRTGFSFADTGVRYFDARELFQNRAVVEVDSIV